MWQRIRKIEKENQLLRKLHNNYILGRLRIPYPRQLMIVTTRKCNSRCKMCNIWNSAEGNELKIGEYERFFSLSLFKNIEGCTLTGGEAALRSDLVELADLLVRKLPRLRDFGIATNGLASSLVIEKVKQISNLDKNKNIYVQISLDGIGETHDKIRGIEGFFQKAVCTLDGIIELKKSQKNIGVALSAVIQKDNIHQLGEICDFARKKGAQIVFSPVIVSEEYYSNKESENVELTGQEKKTAADFLKKISKNETHSVKKYYKDVVIPILLGKIRKQKCLLGYDYLTIESDGNVPVCINAEKYSITSFRGKEPQKDWFRNVEARELCRREICPKCASACSMDCFNLSDTVKIMREEYGK